jgi:hypothetical protein
LHKNSTGSKKHLLVLSHIKVYRRKLAKDNASKYQVINNAKLCIKEVLSMLNLS